MPWCKANPTNSSLGQGDLLRDLLILSAYSSLSEDKDIICYVEQYAEATTAVAETAMTHISRRRL